MSKVVTLENLNSVMEFGHVIHVHSDGTVTEPRVFNPPEVVYRELDADGQCVDDEIHDLPDGWTLLRGYTGQYGYNGPVMHPSEFIGGRLARDILSTPGMYAAVVVDGLEPEETGDDTNIGWAVAFKETEI